MDDAFPSSCIIHTRVHVINRKQASKQANTLSLCHGFVFAHTYIYIINGKAASKQTRFVLSIYFVFYTWETASAKSCWYRCALPTALSRIIIICR